MPYTPGSKSSGRQPADPFMAFKFVVLVGANDVLGGFADVTGLGADTEVETLRAGGENSAEIMLPGPTKYSARLTLKRGIGHPAKLWQWYQAVLEGKINRRDVTIKMQSANGAESLSWTFRQAVPVKWSGPELHAANSAVAFEAIELVHKGFMLPAG